MKTENGGTDHNCSVLLSHYCLELLGKFGAFASVTATLHFCLEAIHFTDIEFLEYYFYTLSITTPLDLDSITVRGERSFVLVIT